MNALFILSLIIPFFAHSISMQEQLVFNSENNSIYNKSTPKIFFSQANQDEFVYFILYELANKKNQGYYLEIGAQDPVINSNTNFFEKNYDWKGVSIEINKGYLESWSQQRTNSLLIEDATKSDYVSILQPFPQIIDYLSLDVDGNYDYVLSQIPLHNYIFKIITIEHDFYRFGDIYRGKEREILKSYGYYLLCPDVVYPGLGSFEDWWIHPSAFEPSLFLKLISLDLSKKDYAEIIKILKNIK